MTHRPRPQEQLVAAEAARGPLALDEQYAVVSVRHSRAQLPLRSPPEPALPRSPLEPTPAPCVPHGPCVQEQLLAAEARRRAGYAQAARARPTSSTQRRRNPPRPCTSFRFELCTT